MFLIPLPKSLTTVFVLGSLTTYLPDLTEYGYSTNRTLLTYLPNLLIFRVLSPVSSPVSHPYIIFNA